MSAESSPSHRIAELNKILVRVMDRDRHRFARRLRALKGRARHGDDISRPLSKLEIDMGRSAGLRHWRTQNLPRPNYPMELPVSLRRDEIAQAIREHQVVVLAGETGSGKTTQLPKICLEAGRGIGGMIGHTQPRRIAARSLANRIAEELNTEVGDAVGCKMRFSDQTRPTSFIKVMTDGILLAETRGDPRLTAYDTIIIDEAHERSLNIDFLLGYLKNLLPKRPDLKLIITSATIDTDRFSKHFDNAPVISVSGRTYPVAVRYRPEDPDNPKPLSERIVDAVAETTGPGGGGDILVFLSGEREIREAADALRRHHPAGTEVLPLFARQSAGEQQRIFRPGNKRRIVLATNVAETSLTVPGIKYVIDPGTARVSRYSTRSKVQRLPVEKISRASADQRKGRCGRLSDGICIRLYSAEDYLARPEFTEPEIRRTNLAAVILKMLSLNLGDIAGFPFVEPPERKQIADGFTLLAELGAVDARRTITPLGRKLAAFSVDPRLGRMILAADRYGCLSEILILTAALSVQDPRERPMDARQKADQCHREWVDQKSDFVAYLNLWRFFEEQSRHLSQNKFRKLCKERFLSYLRLREWRDIHRELAAQVKQIGLHPNTDDADYEAIHKALLSGLLGHVGQKKEKRDYLGARGGEFVLFPGSGLGKQPPKWLVAAELVETGRLFGRTCAAIEPEWVEEVAGSRLKRTFAEPHWEQGKGAVMAWERTSLYGLILCPRRKVHYGPIDPAVSREVFIRQALSTCRINSRLPFLKHNRQLLEEAESAAAKTRNGGVDEEALFRFFDNRLPEGIHNARALDRWYREQPDKTLLHLSRADIMADNGEDTALFPDRWDADGVPLPLSYHFQLGHKADGVTVRLPVHMLTGIDPHPFEWLVPGMVREKVGHLLKNLPKRYRKEFMPWPHWADRFVTAVPPRKQPLIHALAEFLYRQRQVAVPADAWAVERLPDHLKMRFAIIDEKGRQIDAGRDLPALVAALSGAAKRGFDALPKGELERERVTGWDFGPLPESVPIGDGALGHPALVADGERVSLRLLETAEAARAAHRNGLIGLLEQTCAPRMRQLAKLAIAKPTLLHYAPMGTVETLRKQIKTAAFNHLVFGTQETIRTPERFARCQQRIEAELLPCAAEIIRMAGLALTEYQKVHTRLSPTRLRGAPEALDDVRQQFKRLMGADFIVATPFHWLGHLPRFLKAILQRLERLDQRPTGDLPRLAELTPLISAYQQVLSKNGDGPPTPEQVDFGFLLEELRVSLFAPELKTSQPVSVKRLTARLKEISP